MKTITYFENEECSCSRNIRMLQEIRRMYPEDSLLLASAGDFSCSGKLLPLSDRQRAKEYVKAGADLVLSLPIASVLGGSGKKEFAGAALLQRLRSSDLLVIPCALLPGQSIADCEAALRSLVMIMFRNDARYSRSLAEYLAQKMPTRHAQTRALRDCCPDSETLLADPVNRHALLLLHAMLQVYYMPKTAFLAAPAPEAEQDKGWDTEQAEGRNAEQAKAEGPEASTFDTKAAAHLACLLSTASRESLIDISGSTDSMVTALLERKAEILSASSFEEIVPLLQPEQEERIRLFLLKAILGLRKIYMQICSLHEFVPYCYASAANPQKSEFLNALAENSWVPVIRTAADEQKIRDEYAYLLQADKEAAELTAPC